MCYAGALEQLQGGSRIGVEFAFSKKPFPSYCVYFNSRERVEVYLQRKKERFSSFWLKQLQ